MYGGGFAAIPAYLADMFGTQFVGVIYGRLLTACSVAGILGPVIVNYIHDTRKEAGIAPAHHFDTITYITAALLILGFTANFMIHLVDKKWPMSEADVESARASPARSRTALQYGSFGIARAPPPWWPSAGAALNGILGVPHEMREAVLVLFGVASLRREAVGDPDVRLGPGRI